MRTIWVTSDNHFNHKNIIRYCKRPFRNVREMNEYMIKKWNQKVSKNDVVIHLGDFAFKRSAKYFKRRLNGQIILILGNHDRKVSIFRRLGFKVIKNRLIIGKIIFTHRPLKKYEIPNGFVNVHGHIHEKKSWEGINVCVEKTRYTPIKLSSLKRKVLFKKIISHIGF